MSRTIVVRVCTALSAGSLIVMSLSGCGASSSSGSSPTKGTGGTKGNTPPPQFSTPTRQFASTPTPTATPVDLISGDIVGAAKRASAIAGPSGATVIVPPGVYGPVAFRPGDLNGPVYLFADSSGTYTGSAPAAVVIRGQSAAITLDGQSGITVDGFTLEMATDAAVLVQGGTGIEVEDCTFSDNAGDAVRFEDSSNGLVFNNLIDLNSGVGVRAFGSTGLEVINNTLFSNTGGGISLGVDASAQPSINGFLENNVINGNTGFGIQVDAASLSGYQADYNLNTDSYDGASPGAHDLQVNPLFVLPSVTNPDLHLSASFGGSGGSPAIDAGDPQTDQTLLAQLEQLTTESDFALDVPPPDMGYHFPPPPPTPTPRPKKTRKPTATPTP